MERRIGEFGAEGADHRLGEGEGAFGGEDWDGVETVERGSWRDGEEVVGAGGLGKRDSIVTVHMAHYMQRFFAVVPYLTASTSQPRRRHRHRTLHRRIIRNSIYPPNSPGPTHTFPRMFKRPTLVSSTWQS